MESRASLDDLAVMVSAYVHRFHPSPVLAFNKPQGRHWVLAHEVVVIRFFLVQGESGFIRAVAIARGNPVEGFEFRDPETALGYH